MHLALNSLFLNIARILWAFDIQPVKGADGKAILPGQMLDSANYFMHHANASFNVDTENFTNGFNSKPVSFDCHLVPRSSAVVNCIESEYLSAKTNLDSWQ